MASITPSSAPRGLGRPPREKSRARAREERFPLEWKIVASLCSAVLVLVVSWVAERSLTAAEESRAFALHTRQVVDAIADLHAALASCESAARAYLLTSDASFADAAQRLQAPAAAGLVTLEGLTAADPKDDAQQTALVDAVHAELALLDREVSLARSSQRDQALTVVLTEHANGGMARIDSLLAEMRAREEGVLATRRATTTRDVVDAQRELWLGSGMAFVLAALMNLFVWRDVRERARAHALITEQARALAAANRARDDVQAIVSHDLRNPLNTVAMTASLLRSHLQAGAEDMPLIERIERAVARMNRLIQDLLDASRIDAGKMAVAQRAEPGGSLLDEAMENAAALAEAKGCAVLRGEVDDALVVSADRDRVLQLFSNLIGNALKFTPQGGTITLSLRRAGRFAELAVNDTGKGIEPKHLPHLFDRYWKESEASRDGAGLGLFIAKGIVEAHGGTIDVTSEVGRGTSVRFTLPLAT